MDCPRYRIAILAAFLLFTTLHCASDEPDGDGSPTADGGDPGAEPFRFAVFSDPHFYDTDLGTTGSVFDSYLLMDRKLLAESPAILEATVEALLQDRDEIDFVIVPGDLSKDGELSSHQKFVTAIRALEENGLEVYVCPGNHDINNPMAASFDGDTFSPVQTITPERFAELYADFGYAQAVERHADSLSYLVEPLPDLWVLAVDSCKYRDNLSADVADTSGALTESTLLWIEEKVAQARQQGKTIFAFMHHGLVEHFTGQSGMPGIGDQYVVDDWEAISRRVADFGLRLVFSGHYHAQDVTRQGWEGSESFLFDVETGSLVSYPDPYRKVSIDADGRVAITSHTIDSIDHDTGGQSFPDYSREFLARGIDAMAGTYMTVLQVSPEMTEEMQPVAVEAFLQHYAGDEDPDPQSLQQIEGFVSDADQVIALLGGYAWNLVHDLEPADNDVVFNMETGEIE